jgi:hypothetical protein
VRGRSTEKIQTTLRLEQHHSMLVHALRSRVMLIMALFLNGRLAQWQHGDDLDDAVFQWAAKLTIDKNKIGIEWAIPLKDAC